jgi:hypothetical protein
MAAWIAGSSSSTVMTLAQALRDLAGERPQTAELTDDHTQVAQRCANGAELLELTDGCHART